MKCACVKFLNLMQVEMDDLDANIDALMCGTLERWRDSQISEHVCLSNLAVLRKEKHTIAHFKGIITRLRAEEIDEMSELLSRMQKVFREDTDTYDLSPAACVFAEHKMQRIEDYVNQTHWSDAKDAYINSVSMG